MKIKLVFLAVVLLAFSSNIFAESKNETLAPQVTFESARIVHRVKHNNKWWMRIHIKFRINNALSTPCKLIAYFYNDVNGKPLEARENTKYRTTDGNVAAWKDFTPGYTDAVYNDFQIYVPYEELLDAESGEIYDLKYYLAVYDNSHKKQVGKSGWYKFSLKY